MVGGIAYWNTRRSSLSLAPCACTFLTNLPDQRGRSGICKEHGRGELRMEYAAVQSFACALRLHLPHQPAGSTGSIRYLKEHGWGELRIGIRGGPAFRLRLAPAPSSPTSDHRGDPTFSMNLPGRMRNLSGNEVAILRTTLCQDYTRSAQKETRFPRPTRSGPDCGLAFPLQENLKKFYITGKYLVNNPAFLCGARRE